VARAFPEDGASEFEWLLFEQAGVLTTRQAVEHLGRAAVRTNLTQRRWRAVCRGVLLSENGRLWRDQQLWVAVLSAGEDARLAGVAAVTEGGVRGLHTDHIDVLLPASRTRTGRLDRLPPDMPVVRAHRTTVLPDDHLRPGRPPRTSTARAVIDGAAWADNDHAARTVILSSCQQRRVTPAALRRALAVLPRIRRHRLIATTITDVEGGATALSEIDLVELCRQHSLPAPELQRHRRDADGRSRFLDAYWPAAALHVEIDGAHHMEVRHWAEDMLRQNRIWARGDRILRFPAYLLRSSPTIVAAQLREALTTP
jgi:very-short-patch-repair endonuclease